MYVTIVRGHGGGVYRCCVVLCSALLTLSGGARAQDSHYWNLFYGTQATLLGGAVIGSVSDLSATYYNPGMLAVNREQGLLLGASVYQFQRYKVEQSDREPTTDTWVGPSPSLVAGRVPVDSSIISGIAYSLLTRQYMKTDLENRLVATGDFLGGDGVPEQLSTELMMGAKLSDTWAGVTLFRLVNPQVGIGVTNYLAIRSETARTNVIGEALSSGGILTNSARILNVNYYNVRLLWKFGAAIELDPLTLGLTVTTPSVKLFGTGSLYVNYSGNYSGNMSDTTRKDVLVASNQDDLPSHYNTSWAVGAGVGYRFGKARAHFSAEWYAPVALFSVLETSPFGGQSDGKQYAAAVTQEMKSVINAGVGLQYTLSPSLSMYGSVVTDISSVPAGSTSTLSLTTWDLLHFSAGVVVSFNTFAVTGGVSFAGGSETLMDIPWVRDKNALGRVLGTTADGEIRYFSANVILALTFKL
jgi:hypothetical protein